MSNEFMGLDEWINQVIDEDKIAPRPQAPGKLGSKFLAVPFTILSARDGWWSSRKKATKKLSSHFLDTTMKGLENDDLDME